MKAYFKAELFSFYKKQYGYFIILVEWLTFLATHSRGPDWKTTDEEFPYLCKLVMAKGKFSFPLTD